MAFTQTLAATEVKQMHVGVPPGRCTVVDIDRWTDGFHPDALTMQAAGGRTSRDAAPLTWRPSANGISLYSLTAVLHVIRSGRMLSLRHVRSESGEAVFVGHWMGMCSAPKGVRRVRCKATALEITTSVCVLTAP